jgi:hypothetical protein
MEQLVPEITAHALSYLDYPSLCRLSIMNSLCTRQPMTIMVRNHIMQQQKLL